MYFQKNKNWNFSPQNHCCIHLGIVPNTLGSCFHVHFHRTHSLIQALFFAFWITVSIFIFSSGNISQCHGAPYACIDWDNGVKRSLGFYFFGLFWNCEVAIGMCQFVIASTAAYWYFSHLDGKETSSPVCKSFCRGLFYHLGSIALGALILCILWILQIFF